ncbi:hypothetical protein ACN3XK_40120 [Actinomadura welshii]
MWPGSDPPRGPRASAQVVKPAGGWYALPVLLLLVAVTGLVTVFAFLWDDSQAADGPSAAGDPVAGVRIQLSGGHAYFVYVRTGRSSPFGCSLEAGNRKGAVELTRQNSWSAGERPAFRYTATFESPVTGAATFRCGGTEGPILVAPDDTAKAYLGFTACAALALAVLAAASFAVTLVRRGAAKRRSATVHGR